MPGTSKPLESVIAFSLAVLSLVVKLMAGFVGRCWGQGWEWRGGLMDRVYCRASVSVLRREWHEDQKSGK